MARVLVVDDAMFIRQIISDLLTRHGHEVVGVAHDGLEAVVKHAELKPDITTLDITMPELDGIAALRQILANDPSAKVIMCSALKEKPKVVEALQAGARDFILKPVKPERMLAAIDKVLGAAAA